MIAQLSNKIASFFIDNEIIAEEEKEVYVYSLEFLLAIIRDILALIIIGTIAGRLIESVFFMIGLVPMRQIIGGYHASSHLKCFFTFLGVYLSFLLVINFVPLEITSVLNLFMVGISAVIVILLAPVDHENKPLNQSEKQKLRNQSRWVLALNTAIILSGVIFFQNNSLFFSMTLGLFTASLSCLIAWLQKINKK